MSEKTTLKKASPIELRQCLEIANQLARSGVTPHQAHNSPTDITISGE